MDNLALLVNEIGQRIETRIDAAQVDGNAGLAKKWATEHSWLVRLAPVILANHINVGFLDTIAIYAAQKVRKLLMASAIKDISAIDKYTRTVVLNADKFGGSITNKMQLASLSFNVDYDGEIGIARLPKAESTASTQSSSTRKALEALRLGDYSSEGRLVNMAFDATPLGRVIGKMFGYSVTEVGPEQDVLPVEKPKRQRKSKATEELAA